MQLQASILKRGDHTEKLKTLPRKSGSVLLFKQFFSCRDLAFSQLLINCIFGKITGKGLFQNRQ